MASFVSRRSSMLTLRCIHLAQFWCLFWRNLALEWLQIDALDSAQLVDMILCTWYDVTNSGYLPTRTISLIVLQTEGWEIASVIWLQLGDSLGCFQPNFGQVFGANTWLGSILWYRDLYTIWSHGSLHSVIRIAILLDTVTWLWVTLIQFGHTDLGCKTRLFGCNFDSLDTFLMLWHQVAFILLFASTIHSPN